MSAPQLFRDSSMAEPQAKTPGEWRNFTTRFPIKACRLKRDGLKFLYRVINERQKEYRGRVMAGLSQTQQESAEDFAKRKERVSDAFVTSVTVQAENGEVLTGNNDQIFDDTAFPTRLKSVFYSTQSVPNAVLNHLPQDRITLFLDFSQPPVLDFGRLPTFPTPNESNFEIAATNEAWFAGAKARLVEFFDERRSGYEWLHGAGVYDIFLFLVGIPLAVWACARLNAIAPGVNSLDIFPKSAIYTYTFFISLVLFRVCFSYSRWVFPKVEVEKDVRSTPFRHRGVLAVILLAIMGPALYDLARAVFGCLASVK
jgi:hypothetical protein